MRTNLDCLIVGGGPAGLSAACAAASCGLETALVDDNARPGGQFFRLLDSPETRRLLDSHELERGQELLANFHAADVEYRPGTVMWGMHGHNVFVTSPDGAPESISASTIILVPGAMERPVPFPGWTLPGVMGAGAADILLRSGGKLPDGPVILAGNGPLLPLLASHLLEQGVRISAWLDTGDIQKRLKAIFSFPASLLDLLYLNKGMTLVKKILAAKIPIIRNVTAIKGLGKDRLEQISYSVAGETKTIPASLLLWHHGIVPRYHMADSAGIALVWNSQQRCWMAPTDQFGRTSLNNVWLAGDGGQVNGWEASVLEGELAAIDAARSISVLSSGEAEFRAKKAQASLKRLKMGRAWINQIFAPNPQIFNVPDETIVCACERVTARQIREAVADGFHDVNEIKRSTRAGMGNCQGRMCGLAMAEIAAAAMASNPEKLGYLKMRQPLRPVTLEAYCQLHG